MKKGFCLLPVLFALLLVLAACDKTPVPAVTDPADTTLADTADVDTADPEVPQFGKDSTFKLVYGEPVKTVIVRTITVVED